MGPTLSYRSNSSLNLSLIKTKILLAVAYIQEPLESKIVVLLVASLGTSWFQHPKLFLDVALKQSPQGISCDIFDKHSQPEYATVLT
jgi:hypothetical protein